MSRGCTGENDLRPSNFEGTFCGISRGAVIQRADPPFRPGLLLRSHKGWNEAGIPRPDYRVTFSMTRPIHGKSGTFFQVLGHYTRFYRLQFTSPASSTSFGVWEDVSEWNEHWSSSVRGEGLGLRHLASVWPENLLGKIIRPWYFIFITFLSHLFIYRLFQ